MFPGEDPGAALDARPGDPGVVVDVAVVVAAVIAQPPLVDVGVLPGHQALHEAVAMTIHTAVAAVEHDQLGPADAHSAQRAAEIR